MDRQGWYRIAFHESASDLLNACEFSSKSTPKNPRDLRGFLPRGHLLRLLRWFFSNHDRETGEKCLQRELREELQEVHEESLIQHIDRLHFRLVRTVIEHPRKVPEKEYLQFRCFHVYEVDNSYGRSAAFVAALLERANDNPQLLVATSSEIIAGHSRDKLISHHAEYLFRRRASRPDLPQADFQRT